MRRLLYTMAVTFVLVLSGFVIVSFVQSKSRIMPKQGYAMPTALPTALAGFPDIEHLPIYPNASVTFTDTESTKLQHITYEVGDGMDKVAEFYQQMLPKEGWSLQRSQEHYSWYNWTNPVEKAFWHMHLMVKIDTALEPSKTVVYLKYGRYPNIEAGLPLYPDAQQATTTRSSVEKNFASGKVPVSITEITYLSSATLQEIADFYASSTPEFGWTQREPGWSTDPNGWYPFDEPGSWGAGNQTGSTNSQEGLYFVALGPRWEVSGVDVYHLLATAMVQGDGRAMIKLHLEEFYSSW